MQWITYLVTYGVIWWITIFVVLPLKITRPKKIGKGHDAGAPAHPHLLYKFVLNSILALVVTVVLFVAWSFWGASLRG